MSFIFDDLSFWSIFFATAVFMLIGLAIWIWVVFIQYVRKSRKEIIAQAADDHFDTELAEMKQRLAALEAQLKQMQSGPA